MLKELTSLLFAIFLMAGAYYIKIARDKEPYVTKNTWKWIMAVGIVSFVVSLIRLVL